jgi:MerR family transcriptional regulator, light-induced transcriptional regulator
MTTERRFPMRIVARRTGLKPDLLRAWERRYRAVQPGRSEGRRRLYSDSDIERLLLLQKVTQLGHRIGDVARLDNAQLLQLIDDQAGSGPPQTSTDEAESAVEASFLAACLQALASLDGDALALRLEQAAIALSSPVLVEQVLMPFLEKVGQSWETGEFRVAHEHLASVAVRSLLGRMLASTAVGDLEPLIIATTPARQLHEFGALAAAVVAAGEGWRVIYLGPNLPTSEILAAVNLREPKAVALSLIYPGDDPHLVAEIELLGRHLPPGTRLLFGGRSARAYQNAFEEIGGRFLTSLGELRGELRSIRSGDR